MIADSLLRRLEDHCISAPNKTALTFLRDDGEAISLTYKEVLARVEALSSVLAATASPGSRALLLYPAGIDFVIAFLASMRTGIVAIPLNLPSKPRRGSRIETVSRDVHPNLVLTLSRSEAVVMEHLSSLEIIPPVISTDITAFIATRHDLVDHAGAVAFVQYTSGSTANPKGVLVNHAMLSANLQQMVEGFYLSKDTVMVGWLPLFHDMGLIGNLLSTLYIGGHHVFMSPAAFLQRPIRWLDAISQYRGTIAGCPNFGWQLCIRHSKAVEPNLDLSSLQIAYVGAEPTRASTLLKFSDTYKDFGFNPKAFFSCYGLAEATLFVSGGLLTGPNSTLLVDKSKLEQGIIAKPERTQTAASLVSCGSSAPGVITKIVDPTTRRLLQDNEVGEIWVSGINVSPGYFEKSEETRQTFANQILNSTGQCFLRTGDLGFLYERELYITGRIKDMLIIRGRNIYPQDVEAVAEEAAGLTRPNSCAAFGVAAGADERLVIVLEADRRLMAETRRATRDPSSIFNQQRSVITAAIQAAVVNELSVRVDHIVFVKPGTFPRTSSGKVQRLRCKAMYQDGTLDDIFSTEVLQQSALSEQKSKASASTAAELIDWLRNYAARRIDTRLMDERRSMAPHIVLDLGNKGFFGWQIPREYSGLDLAHVDLIRIAEQLAAIDVSLALMVGIHNCLGVRTILRFGKEDLKKAWLFDLAKGRQIAAFALTETEAGSNPSSIRTSAQRVEGGWRLNGEKRWTGLAAWSSIATVIAKAIDVDGSSLGTVALAVPMSLPGIAQGPESRTLGVRSIVQNRITFTDVTVPDVHVLGNVGAGLEVAQDAMMFSRFCLAGVATGVMKRSVQLMTRYAGARTIATGRLIDNAVTRDRLIEVACGIEAVSALTNIVAASLDANEEVSSFAHLCCKIVGPELSFSAVDSLVQLLGARGYEETNHAAQLFRDVRLLRIFEGATETLAVYLGSSAIRDTKKFAEFLSNDLNGPEIAITFTNLVEEAKKAEHPYIALSTTARTQWLHYKLGILAADAALYAAIQSRSDSSGLKAVAADWAAKKFAKAAAAVHGDDASDYTITPSELLDALAAYELDIGNVSTVSAGEEWHGDSLLVQQQDKPIKRGKLFASKDNSSEDSSHIKELIHAVILNWARANVGYQLSSIGDDMALETLGIDSLGAAEISLEIEQKIGVHLPTEILLEHNNLLKLTIWCAKRAPSALAPSE